MAVFRVLVGKGNRVAHKKRVMGRYWMHQRLVSALLFIESYFDVFMDSSLQKP